MKTREARPVVVREEDCPFERYPEPARDAVRWRTLLSADRTPSEALTLGVAEIEPGERPPRLHRHAQPEVYYTLAGRGVVTIDGVEHSLRPGTAVFVPGDAEHAARNTGDDRLRILYVFAADSFDQIEYRFSD